MASSASGPMAASKIRIAGMFERLVDLPPDALVVDTTSRAPSSWMRDLSPFYLGPVDLYYGFTSQTMENAWQFTKVYRWHLDPDGDPSISYWEWAEKGWNDRRAHRYPMGKGAIPEFSYWEGEKLSYIEARKRIYAPLYASAVEKTPGYARLREEAQTRPMVVLRDFDGYDHDRLNRSLSQVLNDPRRKMGHAFVLKMMLTNDPALHELGQRTPPA